MSAIEWVLFAQAQRTLLGSDASVRCRWAWLFAPAFLPIAETGKPALVTPVESQVAPSRMAGIDALWTMAASGTPPALTEVGGEQPPPLYCVFVLVD